jgi:hypothetical protein
LTSTDDDIGKHTECSRTAEAEPLCGSAERVAHRAAMRRIDEPDDGEVPTIRLDGVERPRLRVGEEKPPCESPCPGCSAYFFALHASGCDYEQCPACGGQLASCGCT